MNKPISVSDILKDKRYDYIRNHKKAKLLLKAIKKG